MASFMEDVEEIPVLYESLGSTCAAYPMEMEEGCGEDQAQGCLFRLVFQVCITHIPQDDETGESILDEAKCAHKQYIVYAERDRLNRQLVWNFLEDIGVTVEHYMVFTILDCAEKMINDPRFNNNILHMLVDLDIPGSGDEQGLHYYPIMEQI